VAGASDVVAIQCFGRLGPERDFTTAATLADDRDDVIVKDGVIDGEADQLATSDTGLEKEPDDGLVAPILEGFGRAGLQQRPYVGEVGDRYGLFRHRWRPHLRRRVDVDVLLVHEPLEELLERTELGCSPWRRSGVSNNLALKSSMCS